MLRYRKIFDPQRTHQAEPHHAVSGGNAVQIVHAAVEDLQRLAHPLEKHLAELRQLHVAPVLFKQRHTECPRQSALHRVQYRNDHVAQLVHDFKADGAIYEQMKFCTYWSYERVIANQIMPRDYGIHILSIDRPYIAGQSGQLRTRVQAFVESLEMKQLRSAQKEDN